jgi:hypothetical protein
MSPPNFPRWDPSNILKAQIEAGHEAPLLWRPNPPVSDDRRWTPLLELIRKDSQPWASPDPWFWLDPLPDPDLEDNLREAAEVLKGERTRRAGEQAAELASQAPLFNLMRHHFHNANSADHVDVWEVLEGECEDMFEYGGNGLTPSSALTLLTRSVAGGAASWLDWRAWMAVSAWTSTAHTRTGWGAPRAASYDEQSEKRGVDIFDHIFKKMSCFPLSERPYSEALWAESASKVSWGLRELGLKVARGDVLTALVEYQRRQVRRGRL